MKHIQCTVVPAITKCRDIVVVSCSILLCSDVDSRELRQLVASMIVSQPDRYTTAVLGRPCQDYVDWIMRDESWGGETRHI